MRRINFKIKGIKLIIHGGNPNIKLDQFCRKLAQHFFDNTPGQLFAFFEGRLVTFKPNWVRSQYLLRYLFYTLKRDCCLCVFQHSDEMRLWKRVAETMLLTGREVNSTNLRTSDDEPNDQDKLLIREIIDLLR